MKALFALIITALSLSSYAETNSNWLKAAFAEDKKQNFNAGEFSVDAFGTLVRPGLTGAPRWGMGLGADYFITRGFGFGARGVAYNTVESFVDEVDARLIFRAPLWDRVAPYGFVSGVYSFEGDCAGAGAGGGLEIKFTKAFGMFAETGIRVWANCDESPASMSEGWKHKQSSPEEHTADWQTSFGVRLSF